MGIFDIIKDKVSELMSGAGDKVTELTGAELPGAEATDQLTQSAGDFTDTAAAAGQDLAGTTQGLSDTVTDAANDLTGSASEAADSAISNAVDPRNR
ncbi:hypothetical protein KIPE111705_22085 [Kibdelosporangium persicum]|uniref:MT0933-like antitoxin protein n=1 Tax=Kibdelosporangium persicum TaxID=2698649 RepID=A0ABX2FDK4_9PSEU|nr:hypothetical protein [Kibdelosporangium persicum]NRN69446.1 hypothetical protein [Kibdelosporangium persicum]